MPAVPAVTLVREWINSLEDLVGAEKPLALGAFRRHPRSPASGAFAVLSRVGGTRGMTAEDGIDGARISASIFAGTDEMAEAAAVAYANAVEALSGAPAVMGDARCLVADSVTGPLLVDQTDSDRDQFHYLVDATFHMH